MRRLHIGWIGALVIVFLGAFAAYAQEKKDPAPEPKAKEKLVEFNMVNQPWNKVFEWLTDHTGMAFVGPTTAAPTGSFTFINPKGKKYSVPQIIDIINAGLLQYQYVLVRRANNTMTLI